MVQGRFASRVQVRPKDVPGALGNEESSGGDLHATSALLKVSASPRAATFFLVSPAVFAADHEYINGAIPISGLSRFSGWVAAY